VQTKLEIRLGKMLVRMMGLKKDLEKGQMLVNL